MCIYCRRCFKMSLSKYHLVVEKELVCMAVHKIGCTLFAVMSTRVI